MSSLNQGSHEIILPITIDEFFRSYRLDELKRYLDITEKYLQKAKNDWEAWFNEQTKNLTPKERNEVGELYSDTYWDYAETFPRILRKSFFVSVLSVLEYEINVICERLKRERKIAISWSELKGDTLERAKRYCKLAGLDFPQNDPNWQEINNYYLVRNCIVHNRSLIKGFRQEPKLRAYITRKNITSHHDTIIEEITLTEQFCAEAIETIQAFLVELEKNINLGK